jgi:hypothetical protein
MGYIKVDDDYTEIIQQQNQILLVIYNKELAITDLYFYLPI